MKTLIDEKQKNIIKVYHGSTYLFETIDVTKGKPYKDFGRGFYVTQNFNHAKNIALRNKYFETKRNNKNIEAYIYTYELDLNKLSGYKVKKFTDANLEWLQFVLKNRKIRDKAHYYDMVIGPTADDDTMLVINAYLDGLYGEIGSIQALDILLKNIEAENLPSQICFLNNDITSMLIQTGQVKRL